MMLFLDDDPERTQRFRAANPEAVCVTTAFDCIRELKKSLPSILFLDHDLGGRTYDDSSRADCGMEVVRWLVSESHKLERRPVVIVHSWNEPAAKEMRDRLVRAHFDVFYMPFGLGRWENLLDTSRLNTAKAADD